MTLCKKALLIGALLTLPACCPAPCPKWHHHEITTPCFSTKQLLYPCTNEFDGLGLEILTYNCSGSTAFINLYGCPLSGRHPTITLHIDDNLYTDTGILLLGGQKIALPESLTTPLITALSEQRAPTLQVAHHISKIFPTGFK